MAGFFHLWSKTAADNDDADASINWSEGQGAGTVNNSARALMASVASWRDDTNGTLSTAGSLNAYTIAAPNIAYAALATGLRVSFKASFTNTDVATFNINSLGAKALRTADDAALVAGQVLTNTHYTARYDSTANSAAGAWLLEGVYSRAVAMPIGLSLGSSAAPSLAFASDLDCGVYHHATDADRWFAVAGGNIIVEFTSSGFDVNQDFSVGDTSFTVQKNSGNTVIAGTLDAGATTVDALEVTNGADIGGALSVTGATTMAAATLSGALQVNNTLTTNNAIRTTSSTLPIGYNTGAGGTVTQLTSKATSVELNKVCGTVTMHNAALAADTTVSFVLVNSAITNADRLIFNHTATGSIGSYLVTAQPGAGQATIYVRNITAGSLSEAINLGFAVIKGAVS